MIPSFYTEEGRSALYEIWMQRCVAQGRIVLGQEYDTKARKDFFADWLSFLIQERYVDRRKPLPTYEDLAALPFDLTTSMIANIIHQFQKKHRLPRRKRRKDVGHFQWTRRDREALRYIGEMHAVRFDQLQRLLTRLTPDGIEGELLSHSRTWEIMHRWTQAHLARYKKVYHAEPGWASLMEKGLIEADLPYNHANRPSERSLEHLYWINEVRLYLEEQYPGAKWKSERSMQAERHCFRSEGRTLTHMPDGELWLPTTSPGIWTPVDIEVQISRPTDHEVRRAIGGYLLDLQSTTAPLWYFVNGKSRGTMKTNYTEMHEEMRLARSSIKIIDLRGWEIVS